MTQKDLDIRFDEAVALASTMTQASLPQDVQLRLYAFYKQATIGTAKYNQSNDIDLRSAFKTNAWMQISHYSIDEAKEAYIDLIYSINENNSEYEK
ncbi:acyl-CoA-binding protein [Flavobacterium agrisoli]|uniref:Acyl-CoA-binding protein n=1 Tax=Flavobacterium agrisoli TaxID=2793066 RepID=A0A934PM43_9FLAO|nr:acyl-CoA-binding protein [Flavobacterium agrisoli]MBK0368893.1 acyl-CoA-binding protein [Flavobacterium agrisoli]